MYPAMLIADYIVEKSIEGKYDHEINNLELQKYLYFLNARFLVEKGEPLFEDDIEKWKFGPVIPKVYHEYKNFGSGSINVVSKHEKINFSDGKITFSENPSNIEKLKEFEKNMIDTTVEKLSEIDRFELVDITHEHTEWKKDELRIMNGERHLKYSKDGIQEYFSSNATAQIWN